jgi:hypothetical protein
MDRFVEKAKQGAAGFLALGFGVFLLLMVNLNTDGAQAPMWVVNAAVSSFVLAGISIVASTFGFPLVSRLATAAIAWALAVPGLWIMLDGQGAQCSASVPLGGLPTVGSAASGLCRTVFGMGGLVTLAIAVVFTVVAFRRKRPVAPIATPISGSVHSN